MRTTAQHGDRSVTHLDVYQKESKPLEIPMREIDTLESIALGFRQDMFELKDQDGNGGEMSTSAGFGGEAIIMRWKDGKEERRAVVRGSELLIAWVETFDPKAAQAMREATAL